MASSTIRPFPSTGSPVDEVVRELGSKKDGDVRWAEGRTFGLVFDGGDEVREVAERAARLFLHENALNTSAFPSLGEIQSELCGWTAELLHGPAGTAGFLKRLLLDRGPNMPTLIDADGLNNLSQLADWWQHLGGPALLTPHPGEMATLTGIATTELQQDRAGSARHWASRWNVTVALKGAHTVIAEPAGMVRISPFSNPGLASGGTGDVLSGIITGLMAQGLSPNDAACCGVFLHGQVAETLRERSGDAGMLASDLIEGLPIAINQLRMEAG